MGTMYKKKVRRQIEIEIYLCDICGAEEESDYDGESPFSSCVLCRQRICDACCIEVPSRVEAFACEGCAKIWKEAHAKLFGRYRAVQGGECFDIVLTNPEMLSCERERSRSLPNLWRVTLRGDVVEDARPHPLKPGATIPVDDPKPENGSTAKRYVFVTAVNEHDARVQASWK